MNPPISLQPRDMFVQQEKINVGLKFCGDGENPGRLHFCFSAVWCLTAA